MSYTYRGNEYELKPLTLGLKAALVDLVAEQNRLIVELMQGVDDKPLRNYEKRLKQLEYRLSQYEGTEKAESIAKEIAEFKEAAELDGELARLKDFKEQQMQLVTLKMIYNEALMKNFVSQVLNKKPELDFSDPETEIFLARVYFDFFFLTQKNSGS